MRRYYFFRYSISLNSRLGILRRYFIFHFIFFFSSRKMFEGDFLFQNANR